MTLQELAEKEDELHSKTIDIYHKHQTTEVEEQLKAVFIEYKEIYRIYADFSARNIEALKRGLFIQWYALTEPSYLTGISDLDEGAENKVIQNLNELILAYKTDNELNWMLNYYSNWDWVFKRHKSFQGFDTNVVNEQNNHLPDGIDKETMKLRGQMGKYWNSLNKFSST